MDSLSIFILLSLPVIFISYKSLLKFSSHGFYRFLSWEAIIWLFAFNYAYWFFDPFGIVQIFSWIFLLVSLYLVISGVIMLKRLGKPGSERNDHALYSFEKTSHLVNRGIYRYIRHPMYSSLLFLTWGIYFKNPTLILLIPSFLSSLFLFVTAILDERECIRFFGEEYQEYMGRTKRFIPFLI